MRYQLYIDLWEVRPIRKEKCILSWLYIYTHTYKETEEVDTEEFFKQEMCTIIR